MPITKVCQQLQQAGEGASIFITLVASISIAGKYFHHICCKHFNCWEKAVDCRFMIEQEGQDWTSKQSPVPRRVDLRVSKKKYKHFKMFGTELRKDENGVFEDPCAGDSGGPLMYRDRSSHRWTLIGHFNKIALFIKLLKI